MSKTTDLCPLLWLDLETTGLDKTNDQIIEVAACLTEPTAPFNRIDSGYFHALVQPVEPYTVGDYVLRMHTRNGLWRALLVEETMPIARADKEITAWIGRFVGGQKVTLAGSGVATFDKQVIEHHMPKLHKRLTYYTFDTGVIRRYRQAIGKTVEWKESDATHRAWDDVEDALAALTQYAREDTKPLPPPAERRVALVCIACHTRIELDEPMRLVQAEPPRFQHVTCTAETTPAFDQQGEASSE